MFLIIRIVWVEQNFNEKGEAGRASESVINGNCVQAREGHIRAMARDLNLIAKSSDGCVVVSRHSIKLNTNHFWTAPLCSTTPVAAAFVA